MLKKNSKSSPTMNLPLGNTEKSKIIKNEIVGLKQEKQSEIKSATEKKNVTENKTGK